jgi:hypothetical protein
MKKLLLLLMVMMPLLACAQFTNVTATVQDSNGLIYANCSYSVSYVAPNGATSFPVFSGTTTAIRQQYTGTRCDSFGVLSIRIPANTSITPASSQWRFDICSYDGRTCFSYTTTVTGASQSISAGVQAAAAPLPSVAAGLASNNVFTGHNTFNGGGALNNDITSYLSGIHNTTLFSRITTESGQPDNYTPALFINYQPSGGTNAGGKTKPFAIQGFGLYNSTGEHGGLYVTSHSGGYGDNAGVQSFAQSAGGCLEAGGECIEAYRGETGPDTVLVGSVNGLSGGVLTYTVTNGSDVYRGVGRTVFNQSASYNVGTMLSITGAGTLTWTGLGTLWQTNFGAGATVACKMDADDYGPDVYGNSYSTVLTGTVVNETTITTPYVVNGVNSPYPSSHTSGAYHCYPANTVTSVSSFGQVTIAGAYVGWSAGNTMVMPIDPARHSEVMHLNSNRVTAENSSGSQPSAFITNVILGRPVGGYRVFGNTGTESLIWGRRMENNWALNDAGTDGGYDTYYLHSPTYGVLNADTTTASNVYTHVSATGGVHNNVIVSDPVGNLFGMGTTGSGLVFILNPVTGLLTTKQVNATGMSIANQADNPINIGITGGSTVDQVASLVFANHLAIPKFILDANIPAGQFSLDDANSLGRLVAVQAGLTDITSSGANPVRVNARANSGSTGFEVWGGGAVPAKVGSIDGSGVVTGTAANVNSVGFTPTLLTDSPGAITINAQTCTDRAVAFATMKTTGSIIPTANYALDANIYISAGQAVLNTAAHYRLCNPTAVNITLNAASAFNVMVIQ